MRRLLILPLVLLLMASPAAAIDLFNLKNSLIQFALEQISTEDFTITAENVDSPGDGVTDLQGVAIADREGVWFRAESMGLQWNASRILRGELEINELFARGVEVLRPPKGSVEVQDDAEIAETDDDPFDWPRAPITTRVDTLRLERVFVAEGVLAEQSIRFDGGGSARDEGDIQALTLNVTRTDDVEGRIDLAYERNFETDILKVDLEAREAAGGLVAAIAGLPNTSASEVMLDADGPLTDWGLDFRAETERVMTATGQARVDLEGRIAVTAQFEAVPGPELEPRLATVIGDRAVLDIDVAEDDNGLIRIRQGRLDSPALTLSAEGSYARPTQAVDVDVALDGQAALSRLVEGVAWQGFGFDGRVFGTPEDLSADGAVRLAGLATEPADLAIAELATEVRVQGERVSFDLTGGAEGLRLDRLRPEVVGPADLTARGVYDGQTVTLERFVLDSVLLRAGAEGTVGIAANTVGLDYRVDAPELRPIATAYEADASGAMRVRGRVEGALAAPRLTGEAALEDLTFEGEPYGRVALGHDITAGEAIEGTVDLTATGSPVGEAAARADFRLANQVLDLARLNAEALGATVDGSLTYDLASGLAEGSVALDAPDLSPLSRLAGAPATGSVSGRVDLAAVEGRQNAELDLTARDVNAFEARLDRADIEGSVRDALGAPLLDAGIDIAGAGFREARIAAITGTVEGRELSGAAPGLTLDLTVTDAAGFGARAGEVVLTGEIADVAKLARIDAGLTARALGYQDLSVGTVSVTGTVEDATALRMVEAQLRAETLRYQDITVAGTTADITAADALSDLPKADVTAALRRIGGPVRSASADLTASVTEAGGTARAEAALRLAPVETDGAAVDGARLTATAEDALGPDPRLSARLDTGTVTAGEAELQGVAARVEGLLSALGVTVSTAGTVGDKEVTLDTAATVDATAAAPTVRVTRLEAAYAAETLSLNRPVTVTAGEATAIEGLDMALPEGRLSGDATLYPAGLAAEIELALGDLGLVQRLAGAPVTGGRLDLAARLDTRAGRAGGQATLAVRELAIEGMPLEGGPLGLDAEAGWNGRTASADAAVSGPFGDPFRAEAAVALRPSGGPLPAVPAGGALSGAITWAGDVGEIWTLVPGADHVLDGALDIDLALSGTVDDPQIGGDLALSDGRYENLETGTILTDLTVGSEIQPTGDLRLDATARDGGRGRVEAEVALAGDTLTAQVETAEAVLVRRDDVKAALGIDIRAEGPLTGPDISGTVEITRAEVRLVNATPPSVVTLGDVRIKGEPVPEPGTPAGETIALDIRIFADRDIFVRGRGLDSEWKADIQVAGTAARPRVTGAVEKVRGRLNFAGTLFDLETGEVRFSGGREIDPDIEVRLQAEREGVVGGIEVTGRASDPELGFYSTPSLPEDEVLPRILYGKTSQSMTSGQALQLAAGLAQLLDGSGGVVDSVRSTVGLDTLSVDPTAEGGGTVTAGKNIAEDVFVGVEQSLEGETRVTVEVEVFPTITLDAETGSEGDASVGASWKTDF